MQRIGTKERSEPKAAADVIENIIGGTPASAKESYLKFLAASIGFLSDRYPYRWGVTLFGQTIRLNAGPVECLTLYRAGLNVLVEEKSAPKRVELWRRYQRAPGCFLTTVPLSYLEANLSFLKNSHWNAISIAARNLTTPSIRNAHSTAITTLLTQILHRPIDDPSYISPTALHLLNGGFANNDR
jgi:hypothetical protein